MVAAAFKVYRRHECNRGKGKPRGSSRRELIAANGSCDKFFVDRRDDGLFARRHADTALV